VLWIYDIADLTMRLRDFAGPELGLRTESKEVAAPSDAASREAFGDPETLKQLITGNCGIGTWEQAGVSIAATTRMLIVRQYADVQRQIARLLGELR
jgi:hypothetical protein